MKYSASFMAVAMMALLFSGCFASQMGYRGNGQWSTERASIESAVVMRPIISMGLAGAMPDAGHAVDVGGAATVLRKYDGGSACEVFSGRPESLKSGCFGGNPEFSVRAEGRRMFVRRKEVQRKE